MYKQIKTKEKITLKNGVKVTPVATLADEYGGMFHIWIDDDCYVFGKEKGMLGTSERVVEKTSFHIFEELFNVLKSLPSPRDSKINSNIVELGQKILFKERGSIFNSSNLYSNSQIKEGIIREQIVSGHGSFIKIDDKWYDENTIIILASLIVNNKMDDKWYNKNTITILAKLD
jgi:hypothetical protein